MKQRRTNSPSCSTRRPRTWSPATKPAPQPAVYTDTGFPCTQALPKTGPDHKDGVHVSSNIKARTSIANRPALKSKVLPSHTAALHRDEANDEANDTHPYIQTVLHRDEAKNSTEQGWTTGLHRNKAIDEAVEQGVTTVLHRERRKYLRTTHKDLTCTDRPGLLGPKATETQGARDWARESAGLATR